MMPARRCEICDGAYLIEAPFRAGRPQPAYPKRKRMVVGGVAPVDARSAFCRHRPSRNPPRQGPPSSGASGVITSERGAGLRRHSGHTLRSSDRRALRPMGLRGSRLREARQASSGEVLSGEPIRRINAFELQQISIFRRHGDRARCRQASPTSATLQYVHPGRLTLRAATLLGLTRCVRQRVEPMPRTWQTGSRCILFRPRARAAGVQFMGEPDACVHRGRQ